MNEQTTERGPTWMGLIGASSQRRNQVTCHSDMNTYLVYRYRQQNGTIGWTGSNLQTRIHDAAIYPVWQVRAPSLREAVRQTREEWRFRQMSQLKQQMSWLTNGI